jgi:integrase
MIPLVCGETGSAGCRLLVGAGWEDTALVFATQIGTPLEPKNVNRGFTTARSAADLE